MHQHFCPTCLCEVACGLSDAACQDHNEPIMCNSEIEPEDTDVLAALRSKPNLDIDEMPEDREIEERNPAGDDSSLEVHPRCAECGTYEAVSWSLLFSMMLCDICEWNKSEERKEQS